MKRPRPSLTAGRLMVAVLLVAVNLAIVRGMAAVPLDIGIAFVMLPMVSILILVAPGMWRDKDRRPFWIGFEIAGWTMAATFGYLSWSHGPMFFRLAKSVYPW